VAPALDPARADAADQLRTAVARIDSLATVSTHGIGQEDRRFAGIRRAIYIGSAATLALIGASMLVAILESLRERRRLFAILVAFGTPRSTLAWSVLWQTLIPVMLGLIVAVGFGLALGSILLAMVDRPIRVDATSAAAICALALALVAGVTALSLPPLWRLMRPDGLRTE
jgi:ABC-type antimicrobial peptide transport system permease subunit